MPETEMYASRCSFCFRCSLSAVNLGACLRCIANPSRVTPSVERLILKIELEAKLVTVVRNCLVKIVDQKLRSYPRKVRRMVNCSCCGHLIPRLLKRLPAFRSEFTMLRVRENGTSASIDRPSRLSRLFCRIRLVAYYSLLDASAEKDYLLDTRPDGVTIKLRV